MTVGLFVVLVALAMLAKIKWDEWKNHLPHVVYLESYKQEHLDWLRENVHKNKWRGRNDTVDRPIYFKNANDAITFKLTFSDDLEQK